MLELSNILVVFQTGDVSIIQKCILIVLPWTADWQTAAKSEPLNPANPLVASLFGGWQRTHISTEREKDKANHSISENN